MLYRFRLGEKAQDIKAAEIYKILSFHEPQTLQEIAAKLSQSFPQDDPSSLASLAESFLMDLEAKGIVVSGETDQELKKKDWAQS